MENASQALRMGAAVIVFMLAISLFFHSFSSTKKASDSILKIQDKQAYLESDGVENILYKSDSGITADTTNYSSEGNRIVGIDSVISTIYKYDKEKFGVTIFDGSSLIARYDSSTESLMNNWNNILESYVDDKGTTRYPKQEFIDNLNHNLTCRINGSIFTPNINEDDLTKLYKLNGVTCAPWYGNHENIMRRINADITRETNVRFYDKTYNGIGLYYNYNAAKFYEITKEIDTSEYYTVVNADGSESEIELLKEYHMPTVEIIYVLI